MDFQQKDRYGIEDLKQIMVLLRSENGCPWDREQTHASIRRNLIEETYEVCEAIDKQDAVLLREELGDLLLQVVFHAQMEAEKSVFQFDDVVNDICQKLIVRHPHVFGEVKASNLEEALDSWNAVKQKTKGQTTAAQTLESVPRQLPALMRSEKVQSRARKAGFDYHDVSEALADLDSEVRELHEAVQRDDSQNVAEELGDLLFSAVNVSRFYGLDPEETLGVSCEKFIRRFALVEQLAKERHIDMKQADMERLNQLWKEAKHQGSIQEEQSS